MAEKIRGLIAATLLAAACCVQAADAKKIPVPDDFKIPLWYEDFSLRGCIGYKDNVRLSTDSQPVGSAFWCAGADMMIYRLPSAGWQFYALASFDNTSYLNDAVGIPTEQTGMAMVQVTRSLPHDWKIGLGANYFYQDQITDTSVTETNQAATEEVLGHSATGRIPVRKDFKPWWVEGELSFTRQWFAAPLDSFLQPGARITLGRSYGRGSDVTLAYAHYAVLFDTRGTVTSDGYANPGTSLRFAPQTAELAWHHVWDGKKRWHTTTKLGFDMNEDNGSGYFDYRQYRVAQQLKFRAKTWEVSANARAGYYEFPVQTVSSTDTRLRHKTLLAASVRAEKSLGKSFKVYCNYAYDQSLSNATNDRYQANTTSAGVEYHF